MQPSRPNTFYFRLASLFAASDLIFNTDVNLSSQTLSSLAFLRNDLAKSGDPQVACESLLGLLFLVHIILAFEDCDYGDYDVF